MRHDGRLPAQLRPLDLQPDFVATAHGSVLFSIGRTRVICTATIEEGVAKHHDHLHAGGLIIAALFDRTLEELGGLQKAVVVESHGRE